MFIDDINEARQGDDEITDKTYDHETIISADCCGIDFQSVTFEGCRFIECNFGKASFYGCRFLRCDLSNSKLPDSYWKDCTIENCKGKGACEKELYEAEVQIMVSQIRPHFMYNTLSSIAILCKLDPETAYEAAITFSKYLRVNMDSLKKTEPVPFEQEPEHLKNYLYIEKLRFADKLNVEYDIRTADFRLPMLSIQPIVENAVKHGVGMKKEGGTVTVSTRETADAYEITVSDDGVGFDMNAPISRLPYFAVRGDLGYGYLVNMLLCRKLPKGSGKYLFCGLSLQWIHSLFTVILLS